jgi:transcriptional regulator with XRE-family HTH domain
MTTDGEKRRQLGQFLRQCRERLKPQAVGLPPTKRRRTPGLRREEVALLAGISTAYYTKIEQGRVDTSAEVLSDLLRVLKLSHTERTYAIALATGLTPHHAAASQPQEETISPVLRTFLDAQNPCPAQILSHRWDILAWNQASCAVLSDLDRMPPEARNLQVMLFTAPQVQDILPDWEVQARRALAEFRADYVHYQDDPSFAQLVADLCANSPQFQAWWAEPGEVGSAAEFEKPILHPTAGLLRLYETIFTVKAHPNLRALLFLPQDEATAVKLQELYDARIAAQERVSEGSRSPAFVV